MTKLTALAALAAACLVLGACNVASLGPIALTAATAATAPSCAAIAAKTAVPANICTDAAGNAISILSALAANGVKAHIVGRNLYIDALPKGGWGKLIR